MDREQLAESLSAYLDGELTAEEAELIDRLLNEDEEARQLLDELRRTAVLVSSLPRHRAPSSIAEDLRNQLERSELLNHLDPSRSVPGGRRWFGVGRVAVAAMLGFIVVGTLSVMVARHQSRAPSRAITLARKEMTEEVPVEQREAVAEKEKMVYDSRSGGNKGARRGSRGIGPGEPDRVDETLAPGTLVADRRRGGRAGSSPEALIDTLDLEHKLAEGASPTSLRHHAFASEPYHLQVRLRDEAERDEVSARLAAQLAKYEVIELAEHATDGEVKRFHHAGEPGVNFDNPDEQQILVRASARQIEEIVDELASAAGADDRIALWVESVPFRGEELARAKLRQVGWSQTVVDGPSREPDTRETGPAPGNGEDDAAPSAPGELASRGDELFLGLFRRVGLDPSVLPTATGVATDETSEEQATGPAPPSAEKTDAEARRAARGPAGEVAEAGSRTAEGTAQGNEVAAGGAVAAGDRERPKRGGPLPDVWKERPSGVLPEPIPLVERRLQELEAARRAASEVPRPAVPEPLITVVVQLTVDKPEKEPTVPRPTSKAGARVKSQKPGESGSKMDEAEH